MGCTLWDVKGLHQADPAQLGLRTPWMQPGGMGHPSLGQQAELAASPSPGKGVQGARLNPQTLCHGPSPPCTEPPALLGADEERWVAANSHSQPVFPACWREMLAAGTDRGDLGGRRWRICVWAPCLVPPGAGSWRRQLLALCPLSPMCPQMSDRDPPLGPKPLGIQPWGLVTRASCVPLHG